jgi:hypothetical protein
MTSTPQSTTAASVTATLLFTDPGANLASLTVTVLDGGGQQLSQLTAQVQGASGQKSGTLSALAQFTAATPAVFTIQVYVADANGQKSNTLSTQFQVVAAASMAAVVTATGPSPSSLTESNGRLYWLESGEDALKSVAVDGSSPQVLATRMVNPVSVAYFGLDAIWTDLRRDQFAPCPAASPDQVIKRTTPAGVTSVLASTSSCGVGSANLTVAGGTLFWTSSDPSVETLHATPLAGGATATVATSAASIVHTIANGGTLYWLELDQSGNFMATIRSVPVAGGPIATLLSGVTVGVNVFEVDATNMYYTVPTGPNAVGLVDLISRPLTGGAPTALATAIYPPFKLISTGNSVVWFDGYAEVRSVAIAGGAPVTLAYVNPPNGGPYDLAFDGTNIFWIEGINIGTSMQQGVIRAMPAAGGAVTTVYQSNDLPAQLAVDPALRINWINRDGRGLASIARLGVGNNPETVADGISSNPPTLVLTATSVFVPDLRRIKSIPIAGGLPTNVAVDIWTIANLATDGTSLVWNSALDGTLHKAPVTGGAVTVLADTTALGGYVGKPGPIRIGPNGNAYWIVNSPAGPGNLLGPPSVLSAPVAATTAAVTTIAPNLLDASDLAPDATGVYIGENLGVGPGIIQATLDGTGSPTTIDSNPLGVHQLLLDGSTIYWMGGMQIARIPKTGGAEFGVLDYDTGIMPGGVAVDATSVYFTEPFLQDIRRTPK